MKIEPADATGKIVEPFIYDGTTYLPVRAVGEAIGKSVTSDGATQSVYLGDKPGDVKYMMDICPYEKRQKRNQSFLPFKITFNWNINYSVHFPISEYPRELVLKEGRKGRGYSFYRTLPDKSFGKEVILFYLYTCDLK